MSTIANLIDELQRDFLETLGERPVQATITAGISDIDPTVVFDDMLSPEEQSRLAVGGVVEIGSELLLVTGFDPTTRTVNITRHFLGSTAASHAAGDTMTVSPDYPRLTVFTALRDAIGALWPDLWQTKTAEAVQTFDDLWMVNDTDAKALLAAWGLVNNQWVQVQATLSPTVGFYTAGLPVNVRGVTPDRVQVNYRARLSIPTDETDTLASLGINDEWASIIKYGALVPLVAGRDFDAATVQYMTEALETATGVRLGTSTRIALNLLRVQENLIQRAVKSLTVEHPIQVVMNEAL